MKYGAEDSGLISECPCTWRGGYLDPASPNFPYSQIPIKQV